ncbi:MAG: RtcB family protein [Pirellulaceae bacterium]
MGREQDASGQEWIVPTGEATGIIPVGEDLEPIQVIGNDSIRQSFGAQCLQQAVNSRLAPGVTKVVLNPDAHLGYGAPVGCVMVAPDHIYPGPVGVDIKCSMSLLQTDLPESELIDRKPRKELMRAILQRIPTGPGKGQRSVPKSRLVDERLGREVVVQGASRNVLRRLGIPGDWADRCEDARHYGPAHSEDQLAHRLEYGLRDAFRDKFPEKCSQLGSYGGGNHFGECEIVRLADPQRDQQIAEVFGLRDGCVAFLSHCGSRGLGHGLAMNQFHLLQDRFRKLGRAFPAGDRQLVYAEIGTPEAEAYLCDMAMGANYATVNHLLINSLVLDAFQQVFPGVRGELVYFISHNIARREEVDGQLAWVHRKGATRAFPAGHPDLARTPFAQTGHPILLPGNPRDGSAIMVGLPGAAQSCYSINHGAGRAMSRTMAKKTLRQEVIDQSMERSDILSNCRFYPIDEAPEAYKSFPEVLRSVEQAGLARTVAKLEARFVLKDGAPADD